MNFLNINNLESQIDLVNLITNTINEAADKFIPSVKAFNFRESFPPNLVSLIKDRRKIRKKIKNLKKK
jgi:hypothetical protein